MTFIFNIILNMNDYKTFTYEEKKSRFIAYVIKLDSKEEFNNYLQWLWKEHKKASHICYAYKFFDKQSQMLCVKAYDDGEPKGTAGYPILNSLIEKNNLNDIAILVVRYFGGKKLGAGPLLSAYLKAAKGCLKDNLLINTNN